MSSVPPSDSGDAIGNEEPTDVNRMAVPWNRRSSDGLETLGSESGASSLGTAWFESGTYELKPGMTLGEYRIEGKIGQGGMGVVFGAIHPTIGKRAAIKVLKKELCKDPLQLERFVSEARVVNEINHPNIVDIFAFSEMPDGRWYFVMEWLKGETLYQRIHRAPFTFADLVMVVRPVCRALEAAHGKGITHRDLKPENIFLVEVPNERQPHIKLLDFGLAKLQRSYERNHNTAVGTIIGTPQYMAPEQAAGGDIDHRVDVYALGGIMFELLTGRPPFQADNAIELVAKHVVEAAIRPSSLVPEIPTVIDELIIKMLAKTPEERPPLSEVIRVIERVRWRPGSAMMITTVRQPPPAATPLSDSMSEEEPTTQANDDFSQLMGAQGSLSDQIIPTLSEQLVPTLSEQLAMPVAREHKPGTPPSLGDSLESKPTFDEDIYRPPADSMELGPPGASRPLPGSHQPLELGPPGATMPPPRAESPPSNAPRPTLQGPAVLTPTPLQAVSTPTSPLPIAHAGPIAGAPPAKPAPIAHAGPIAGAPPPKPAPPIAHAGPIAGALPAKPAAPIAHAGPIAGAPPAKPAPPIAHAGPTAGALPAKPAPIAHAGPSAGTVPTKPPPVAHPGPLTSGQSGPTKALKPTTAGSSGQLRSADIAEAAATLAPTTSTPTPPPTKLPRATTGPPTINLPSDDAIRAAIGEALDAAGAVGADDPLVQSGDNFVIRIKNKGLGVTGDTPSVQSGVERAPALNLSGDLQQRITEGGASPIPSGLIATPSGVERRRAESPRELIQPPATSTVIKRQPSAVPWVFVVVILAAVAAVLALFVF